MYTYNNAATCCRVFLDTSKEFDVVKFCKRLKLLSELILSEVCHFKLAAASGRLDYATFHYDFSKIHFATLSANLYSHRNGSNDTPWINNVDIISPRLHRLLNIYNGDLLLGGDSMP